jgi:uncharacterized membrane protein YfcA
MEILGYLAALLIGLTLGLIGGGGSILTVPVLVYLLGVGAELSTAYSLFIVGLGALAGSVQFVLKGQVNFKVALLFAPPSFLAVFLTRKYLMPAIPQMVWETATFSLDKNTAILLFFALLMVLSAYSMIKKDKAPAPQATAERQLAGWQKHVLIMLEGLVVGTLTGIVGAGGGFLIVPALVLLAGLEMKTAVATSLLIIAAKSLIGFTGDLSRPDLVIDWPFLLGFSAFVVGGIFVGIALGKRIPGSSLKRGFGWFVLVFGSLMIAKELMHL